MICTFFGHKNAPVSVKEALKTEILRLLDEGVVEFYVGNNGSFDYYVQEILSDISKIRPEMKFSVVISYLNEKVMKKMKNLPLFPEGLEKALPRFAINKRNEWLIKKSDVAIVYVKNTFTNSYKLMVKAIKKGIKVINLGEKV